jgi:hypothetical protein
MNVEIVDPAWEISNVIRQLLTQPASNELTWTAFQKSLGQTISPSEHWELMSALNSRLLRLDALVRSVQDKELEEAQRQRIIQAVGRFANVLLPAQQSQPWQHTLQNYLKADDGLQLSWFSIVAKRYQPLRRITGDEKDALIAKIDEAVEALKVGTDVPEWAKYPISEGLRRLRFMLQHLMFFGVESAIDLLLEIYTKASAIEPYAEAKSKSGEKSASTLWKVLTVVSLAANLFWLPDQATTAFERYQGWYLKIIVDNPMLPKPEEIRLLAPPEPTDEPHDREAKPAAIEPTPPQETANENERV